MAEIRVDRNDEREPDRLHREPERRGVPPWVWLLVAAVVLGLLLWPMLSRQGEQAAMEQDRVGSTLAYQGQVYMPENEVVSVPDANMVRIGSSTEGQEIYGVRTMAGGGGGQVAGTNLPAGRMYVRVSEGRYRMLTPR